MCNDYNNLIVKFKIEEWGSILFYNTFNAKPVLLST